MQPERTLCHCVLKLVEEGCMIVSMVHVDLRAAVTNPLIRREFSCEEMVKCGEDTGAADVGGYTLEGILSGYLEEAPQPSSSKMIREHVVASDMIFLRSVSLTKKLD